MNDPYNSNAPLFSLFWRNSQINETRGKALRAKIAQNAAMPYEKPMPAYAQAASPLPKVKTALTPLLAERTSTRAFADKALTEQDLSRLLLPFAERKDGSSPLPSGGAKYPLQFYGARFDAKDEGANTLFWYDPKQHGILPLGKTPSWEKMREIAGCDWQSAPALLLFVTGNASVMIEKYGERGGRFLLLEAGSAMLALSLSAAEAGLGGVALGAFDDQKVRALFDRSDPACLALLGFAVGYKT